jgi:hypothetical protein
VLMRVGRRAAPRSIFAATGAFEGLAWSIDGRVLVLGLPGADQWLFVRPGAAARLQAVERIRQQFTGETAPRTGAFPRPVGWCYGRRAEGRGAGLPPCSSGATPQPRSRK